MQYSLDLSSPVSSCILPLPACYSQDLGSRLLPRPICYSLSRLPQLIGHAPPGQGLPCLGQQPIAHCHPLYKAVQGTVGTT